MNFQLSQEVYLAAFGSEVIFLDLKRDQYIGTGPPLSDAVIDALTESINVAKNSGALSSLVSKGLLATRNHETARSSIAAPLEPNGIKDRMWRPLGGTVIYDPQPTTMRETLVAIRLLRQAQRRLNKLDTYAVVAHLRRAYRGVRRPIKGVNLGSLIEAHIRARMIYPHQTYCLAGSAALAEHAWLRGFDVRFIVGVQSQPFFAHAWVAFNNEVINDTDEVGKRLAPIVTVPPIPADKNI